MADYTNHVLRLLSENGCTFIRHGKGDHDIWYSPITKRRFTVDGKIKDRHLANGTLDQAGIKYKF
jgi:hypothetical protein